MPRAYRSRPPAPRALAILAALLAAIALGAAPAAAARSRSAASPASGVGLAAAAAVARVERFWTPRRMRAAVPLDLARKHSGATTLLGGRPAPFAPHPPLASASYAPVAQPESPPYSVEGRIFFRQGEFVGYCSGTAIDSKSRSLVLTAGHCINTGPRVEDGRLQHAIWSSDLEFVPAYRSGVAPFGAFVLRAGRLRAPTQWTNTGNPNFDMGAFLTHPNAEGVKLAVAVGGGARIALDKGRRQFFRTFGFPGGKNRMEGCESPYVGDDTSTYQLPGPPTMAIDCHWARGASGGGWLIGDGSEINGITTYLHLDDHSRSFGPYFTKETVGRLVRGF